MFGHHLSSTSLEVCRLRSSVLRGVFYVVLHPRRLLTLVVALLAGALYVWVAAVRAVPGVRERKAAARRRWHERDRGRRNAP
jgi:hypothetical protein